jgi:hypothetical protein
MAEPLTTNRDSRNRRLVAILVWLALIFTAGVLWDGRQSGLIRMAAAEPVAFMLSAYSMFVAVFAWMLFNPSRSSASESPVLFLAGVATLVPPCIIGFCLMSPDSAFRFWLALALLMLGMVAILSPVPEEFFAVPRPRHTYALQGAAIDVSTELIDIPETDWLRKADLSSVVSGDARSSLAPSAYRALTPDRIDKRRPRAERIAERRRKREAAKVGRGATDDLTSPDVPVADRESRPDYRRPVSGSPRPESDVSSEADENDVDRVFAETGGASAAAVSSGMTSVQVIESDEPEVQDEGLSATAVEEKDRSTEPAWASAAMATAADPFVTDVESAGVESTGVESEVAEFSDEPATEAFEAGLGSTAIADLPATIDSSAGTGLSADAVAEEAMESALPVRTGRPGQFERFRDESGAELVEGTMLVRFEPGQKRANIHVPFSPPLPGTPDVECEAVGGEALRLKVPVRQSYGIRIEARRSNTDQALQTEVGFSAIYTPEA